MKKLFLLSTLFAFSLCGLSQNTNQSESKRIKLVPVETENRVNQSVSNEEKQPLTIEEQIENLERQIESGESKIEVLVTEDPEGNAIEIEEKRAKVAEMKEELARLKAEQK